MGRSKKSRNSGSRRPRRPAFAIVLLVLFMATVFWFIVQRQLGSAEARRLRLLAGFADRVEATVGDLGDRFGRVVSLRCANQVADYLKLLPQVDYVSSAPAEAPCPQLESRPQPEERQAGEEEVLPENSAEGGGGAEDQAASQGEGSGPLTSPDEPEPTLTLLSTGPQVRLEYRRSGTDGADEERDPPEERGRAVRTARARLDLESVLEPMIIPGIFDSILVADADGKVLYQHGEPELRMTHLDGLLGTPGAPGEDGPEGVASWRAVVERHGGEPGRFLLRFLRLEDEGPPPAASTGRATTIVKSRIADSDHAVFLQPVTLRLSPLPEQTAPEPVQWIAVGVISREHLLSAGVTTSPILLFLLVSILPLGLVIWPFLKLALISRRQPFTRLDCAFLVLACVLALTFGALLLFDGLFVSNVQSTVDRQLVRLADTVHRSLRLEVYDAYRQLDELNRSVHLSGEGDLVSDGAAGSFDYFRFLEESSADGSDESAPTAFIRATIGSYLDSRPSREPRIYPYFDSVFWADPEGRLEGANLPLREHAVLPQQVSDRGYFQCGKAWEDPIRFTLLEGEKARYRAVRGPHAEDAELASPKRFCLEPFLDRTTGEAVAAVSIRGPENQRDERPVAALVTRFTSMTHPVLLPEIRFAVVNEEGRVLFHSDPRRALTEDFLKATDENRLLQSLLDTRREGHLPLHYWGQRHRAFVRPMEGLPWTLVVFRSMEDLRLRNFELIYDFLNPYVLSLLGFGLLVAGFAVAQRRRFRAYLWPTPSYLREYKGVVEWTLVALAVFVILMLALPWSRVWLFVASFSLVPATVVFVLVMGMLHRRKGDASKQEPVPGWYALLGQALHSRWESARKGIRSMMPRREADAKPGPAAVEPGDSHPAESREDTQATSAPTPPGDSADDRRHSPMPTALLIAGAAVLLALAAWRSDVMAGWLALFLIAVAFRVRRLRFEFAGQRRRIAYRFALECLLLLSLLPALGFLHLARSRQVQFLTQEGTLALAASTEERREAIESRHGPLDHYRSYERALACTRDAYLEAVFGTQVSAPPEPVSDEERRWVSCPATDPLEIPTDGGRGGLWPFGREREPTGIVGGGGDGQGPEDPPGWIESLMIRTFSARPLALNDLSTRPSGLDFSRFHSTLGRWSAADAAPRGRLVVLEPRGAGAAHLPTFASTVPGLSALSDLEVLRALLLSLGLGLLGTAPFLLARFLSEKLLLISLVYYGEAEHAGWVKPGEALEDALDDVGTANEPVKRLVLVAGQLRREAWQDKVGEDWKERGVQTTADGVFWEARFREAWQQSETTSGQDPQDRDPETELLLPSGLPATGSRMSASSSRALRFEAALVDGSAEGQPILLTEFDPDLRDPVAAADQTDALRDLIEHAGRSLVILSETVPFHDASDPPETPEEEEAEDRWIEFLGSFPVRYARDMKGADRFWDLLERLRTRLDRAHRKRLAQGDGSGGTGTEDHHKRLYEEKHWRNIWRTIREECRHTPALKQLGEQLLRELFRDLRIERLQEDIRIRENRIRSLREQIDDPPSILEERIDQATSLEELEGLSPVVEELRKSVPASESLDDEAMHDSAHYEAAGRQSSRPPISDRKRIESIAESLEKKTDNLRTDGGPSGGQAHHAPEPEVKQPRSVARKGGTPLDLAHEVDLMKEEEAREKRTLEYEEKRLARLQGVRSSDSYRDLLTEDHVITRVGAEARLHYRHLWSKCPRDQKLVLVQLARHGLVNPKSSGWVLDLMQKGLVWRAPDVRIMNRSFARFVKQEMRSSQILQWQDELGPNAWGLLKWILPFPLLALAGFLFITQRDAVSNAAGVLVALVSLTPVVFNLYDKFQEINLRQSRADADADEDED